MLICRKCNRRFVGDFDHRRVITEYNLHLCSGNSKTEEEKLLEDVLDDLAKERNRSKLMWAWLREHYPLAAKQYENSLLAKELGFIG